MADAQRIHPVPPMGAMQRAEQPTRPLVPRSTSIPSEKGNPTYNNYPPLRPPRSRSSCFCRVICCIFCLLITILVIIGILGVTFYFVFHPKAPNFSVDKIRITDFKINMDLSQRSTRPRRTRRCLMSPYQGKISSGTHWCQRWCSSSSQGTSRWIWRLISQFRSSLGAWS